MVAVPTRLDDFVFHSVFIGLKPKRDLATENFLNAFRTASYSGLDGLRLIREN
jgi:hypothetical protein